VPEASLELHALGHAGTAAALASGMSRLARAEWEQALLVAVDSLFDPVLLSQLHETRRLKTAVQPVGLMPGEAGICVLLERAPGARRRGVVGQARLAAAVSGREALPLGAETPNTGQGLSTCILQALEQGATEAPFRGDLFSDLNGEEWRAREWGGACVRLGARLGTNRLHLPCKSLGDTGAASGALGVCMATFTLARGHGVCGHALVLSSSAEGPVGCVQLQGLGDDSQTASPPRMELPT